LIRDLAALLADALNGQAKMQPVLETTASGLGLVALYLFTLWNIFKTNPGNKVVRCGVTALVVFVVLAVLMQFPAVPEWVRGSVVYLLFLLCLLTMGFVFQRGYRAVRRRRLWKSD
jgi:hypothetical protein